MVGSWTLFVCVLVVMSASVYVSFDDKHVVSAFQSNNRNNKIPLENRRRRTTSRKTERVVCSSSRRRNGNGNGSGGKPGRARNPSGEDARCEADLLLEYSIDSFLRGDYDRAFSEDASSPLPGLSPSETVDAALRSLRNLDDPEPFHGAAVLLRFCAELGRGERWGTTITTDQRRGREGSWKELLRGALTPTMLARRIRASEEFSGLLDWNGLEITESATDLVAGGMATAPGQQKQPFPADADANANRNVAFVDAALFFGGEHASRSTGKQITKTNTTSGGEGGRARGLSPPELYRFRLAKMLGGVWLIDSVRRSPQGLSSATNSKASERRKRGRPRGREEPRTKRGERPVQKRGDKRKRGGKETKDFTKDDGEQRRDKR